MNNDKTKRKISKLLRLHLKKQNKDLVEFQKEMAVLICDEIMERVKQQIHDLERESENLEGDILNFYRLSVMNQIRFILEVSDEVEAEFRQQIKQIESLTYIFSLLLASSKNISKYHIIIHYWEL